MPVLSGAHDNLSPAFALMLLWQSRVKPAVGRTMSDRSPGAGPGCRLSRARFCQRLQLAFTGVFPVRQTGLASVTTA